MTLITTGTEPAPLHVAIGPDGRPLTMADLPPLDTKRWVTKRKASLVACIRAGLLTLDEACDRYSLSTEEFHSWQTLIETHGIRGLRATRIQHYRPAWTPPSRSKKVISSWFIPNTKPATDRGAAPQEPSPASAVSLSPEFGRARWTSMMATAFQGAR